MQVLAQYPEDDNIELKRFPYGISVGKTYHVISIEYEYFRVVDNFLDPCLYLPIYFEVDNYQGVSDWEIEINDDDFVMSPKVFSEPYFWECLHDGDQANSQRYADIYLKHLKELMGLNVLISRIYKLYLSKRDCENMPFPFWLKEWVKFVFSVKKMIDVRQFTPEDWTQILSIHLSSESIANVLPHAKKTDVNTNNDE